MHGVIVDVETVDLRFPTSRALDGSDAMNEAPDYSAAYVVLHNDAGLEGHGFTFTIGRGNELALAASAGGRGAGRSPSWWPTRAASPGTCRPTASCAGSARPRGRS